MTASAAFCATALCCLAMGQCSDWIADGNCSNETIIMQAVLNTTIYNKHQIPTVDRNAVDVRVEIWIQEISAISEITSDFEIDVYISEMWVDPGLRHEFLNPCKLNLTLGHQVLDRIWVPNSCFINSKFAVIHDSPFRNIFLMLFPNGTVWVNYRVKIKGPCDMDLSKFPMDTQTCSLIYESFNYNRKEVSMRWMEIERPVFELKEIKLPDYELVNIDPEVIEITYPAGPWVELRVVFTFRRRYVWYLFQAFIPTYLTIFLSWVSFSLGHKAIPARTMLGVNSLLAMMFQFGTIMRSLPRVSYVKAIDVWMLTCMTFVFASLLQLAIVGYSVKDNKLEAPKETKTDESADETETGKKSVVLGQEEHARSISATVQSVGEPHQMSLKRSHTGKEPNRLNISPGSPSSGRRNSTLLPAMAPLSRTVSRRIKRTASQAKIVKREFTSDDNTDLSRIDRCSLVLFPLSFSIFNIVYWTYYTT